MTAAAAHSPSLAAVASAGEAETTIAHLLNVMAAMLDVVEQETSLVRAGKLSTAAQLAPVKSELSRLYLADTQRLKAGGAILSQTAPNILGALRRRHEHFQSVMQMNLTVLATAHAVSEGIMRGVSDELAKKSMPETYGASGRTAATRPRHAQPLTVSRVL
jgi:hypothetical protein